MEPGSTVAEPAAHASQKLANLFGTLIALLTLTLPLCAIAYFSSSDVSLQSPATLFPDSRG